MPGLLVYAKGHDDGYEFWGDFLSDIALRATNLFCERNGRLLFNQLEISIRPGEIVQLEGPNGSGKTTLLRYLAGLSTRCEGDLSWYDKPLSKMRNDYAHHLMFIGHEPGVNLSLTPLENLHWYCSLEGSQAEKVLLDALEKVALVGFADELCRNLSAGQRRRVAMARLLLSTKSLWLLDEPFTAIDKHGVAQLETLISDHAANNGMVILTTHHRLPDSMPVRRVTLGNGRDFGSEGNGSEGNG